MSQADLKKLARKFRKQVLDSSTRLGQDTLLIQKDALRTVVAFLRDDPKMAYNFLRHITCVDYLHREPRFELVYVLYSMTRKTQLVIKVGLSDGDPVAESVHDLYGSANWAEREVWDMYGIKFKGHPDLRRVLLYDEFEGHPLRKDFRKQASQPRLELIAPERDAHEEFRTFHLNEPRQGSRS